MASINERIASRIRGELAVRGITREQFYVGAGFAERTGARRLAGTTPWTTDELARVAAFFDVALSALFDDRQPLAAAAAS